MKKDDAYVNQRIAEETSKIKVGSYQRTASLGGWAGGGRTLWAISTVGVLLGGAIGAVAPFFPVLVGASELATAAAAVPASLAVFSATGLSMGFGGGLMLGRVSGTAAAVAEENERRMKEWTVRQILKDNPDAKIVSDEPKASPTRKSLGQRLKDTYRTYFNPKVGLAMTAIGILGGAVLAAGFLYSGGALSAIMPALGTLTGLGAAMEAGAITEAFQAGVMTQGLKAFMAYTVGVGAAFGALWNINLPRITSNVTHMYGELISGRALGREWKPQPEKSQAKAEEPALAMVMETPVREKSFAAGQQRFSLQGLMEQRENGVTSGTTLSR